jgi:hypothetical protein
VATKLPNSVIEAHVAEIVRKSFEVAIPAESFARAVASSINQPVDVDVNEIVFRPARQESEAEQSAIRTPGESDYLLPLTSQAASVETAYCGTSAAIAKDDVR